jgi:hypothetical protein
MSSDADGAVGAARRVWGVRRFGAAAAGADAAGDALDVDAEAGRARDRFVGLAFDAVDFVAVGFAAVDFAPLGPAFAVTAAFRETPDLRARA